MTDQDLSTVWSINLWMTSHRRLPRWRTLTFTCCHSADTRTDRTCARQKSEGAVNLLGPDQVYQKAESAHVHVPSCQVITDRPPCYKLLQIPHQSPNATCNVIQERPHPERTRKTWHASVVSTVQGRLCQLTIRVQTLRDKEQIWNQVCGGRKVQGFVSTASELQPMCFPRFFS